MTIYTNGHVRRLLTWYDLTAQERAELSYAGEDDHFFRYRGETYCLCDLFRLRHRSGEPEEWAKWDAYRSCGFDYGILVRFVDDDLAGDIVVGWYLA